MNMIWKACIIEHPLPKFQVRTNSSHSIHFEKISILRQEQMNMSILDSHYGLPTMTPYVNRIKTLYDTSLDLREENLSKNCNHL